METKQLAIIQIAIKHPMRCYIEYETIEDLVNSISELLSHLENLDYYQKVSVMLPSGETYPWLDVAAHYCFDKGRISVADFVNEMFGKEVAV